MCESNKRTTLIATIQELQWIVTTEMALPFPVVWYVSPTVASDSTVGLSTVCTSEDPAVLDAAARCEHAAALRSTVRRDWYALLYVKIRAGTQGILCRRVISLAQSSHHGIKI
jgi:hypothetical protein